jgi:hypothetical protein
LEKGVQIIEAISYVGGGLLVLWLNVHHIDLIGSNLSQTVKQFVSKLVNYVIMVGFGQV